jgi:hypothetical protein
LEAKNSGQASDLRLARNKQEEAELAASEAIKLRDDMRNGMDAAIDEKIALKIQADERKDHSSTLQLEN